MVCAEKIGTTSTTTTSTTSTTRTTTTTSTTTTTVNQVTEISVPVSTTTTKPEKTCGNESLLDINGVWFCNDDQIQKGTMCQLRCYAGFHSSDTKMKRRCVCTKKGICKWNHKEIECLSTPPSITQ